MERKVSYESKFSDYQAAGKKIALLKMFHAQSFNGTFNPYFQSRSYFTTKNIFPFYNAHGEHNLTKITYLSKTTTSITDIIDITAKKKKLVKQGFINVQMILLGIGF